MNFNFNIKLIINKLIINSKKKTFFENDIKKIEWIKLKTKKNK